MSEIERYRVNPVKWEDGIGWVKPSIHDTPSIYAQEQLHKKGGWCKWSDVQRLENKLKKAHEEIDRLKNLVEVTEQDLNKKRRERNSARREVDRLKDELEKMTEYEKSGACDE